MLNKKRMLEISSVGALLFALIILFLGYTSLSFGPECSYIDPPLVSCVTGLMAYIFIIFVPTFIFSLITFRMTENIFLFWRNFSFIYLFIYLFIIFIAPWEYTDYFATDKGTMSLMLIVTYIVISFFLVTFKYFKNHGN
jgi:hypothetical protein